MLIGGWEKSTLLDYPGKIATTIFTSGCNFNCPFCQNPELVDPKMIKKQPRIEEGAFFDFLKLRHGLLDGVCLTGGEPTIQPDLIDFIKKIKNLDFLVKLDTNGSNPGILEQLFKKRLLDFVAMDIKTSLDRYSEATNREIDIKSIQKSIDLIKNSGVEYEFRTTIVPGLVDEREIKRIGRWLKGSKRFVLQQFRIEKTLDSSYQKLKPYSDEKLKELTQLAQSFFDKVDCRGL